SQIAVLEMFADQAVIAIENTRLFEELQESNRQVTEALEQQTATAEVLRVIASSPTALPQVFTTLAERASRLCSATAARIWQVEGDVLRCVAGAGTASRVDVVGSTIPLSTRSMAGRTVIESSPVHIEDVQSEANAREFPDSPRFIHASRTRLHVP